MAPILQYAMEEKREREERGGHLRRQIVAHHVGHRLALTVGRTTTYLCGVAPRHLQHL